MSASRLFLQCQHYAVKLGVTGIVSIWRWAKKRYKRVFAWLYLCYEAFFQESPVNLRHYFMSSVARSSLRSFKIMQLQRLGSNTQTHAHTQTDCYNPPPMRSG